jgi:hypothetical protein
MEIESLELAKSKMVYTQFVNAKSSDVGNGCMQVLNEIQKSSDKGTRLAVVCTIAKELVDQYDLNITDLFTVVGNRMNKARMEKIPELLTVRRFIKEGEI